MLAVMNGLPQPPPTIVSPTQTVDATALLLTERGSEMSAAISATIDEQTNVTGRVDGLLAAQRGPKTVGAVMLRRQAGRVAQLWTPRLTADEPADTAARLTCEAVRLAADWRCSLVQVAPESTSVDPLAPLDAAGFEHFADLLYMVALLETEPEAKPKLDLQLVPFEHGEDDRLAAVIQQTYVGTLDCPRLNGVRNIEDVIAGHRASGEHESDNWYFACREGRDVGCLLLADHAAARTWELVYFGLIPSVRGHGFGRQLVQSAQWLARRNDARQLVLAVAADNTPAIDAYLASGFVVWDRRPVYLKILASGSSLSQDSATH